MAGFKLHHRWRTGVLSFFFFSFLFMAYGFVVSLLLFFLAFTPFCRISVLNNPSCRRLSHSSGFYRLARNKCLCVFTVRSESLLSSLKRVVYHKMVPMTRTKMHHDNVIRRFLYTLTIKYRFHIHICEQQVTTSEANLTSFPWLYNSYVVSGSSLLSTKRCEVSFACWLGSARSILLESARSSDDARHRDRRTGFSSIVVDCEVAASRHCWLETSCVDAITSDAAAREWCIGEYPWL